MADFVEGQTRVRVAEAGLDRAMKVSSDFDEAVWRIVFKKFKLGVEAGVFAAWKARFLKKRRKTHRKTFAGNFGLRSLQKRVFLGWRGAVSR